MYLRTTGAGEYTAKVVHKRGCGLVSSCSTVHSHHRKPALITLVTSPRATGTSCKGYGKAGEGVLVKGADKDVTLMLHPQHQVQQSTQHVRTTLQFVHVLCTGGRGKGLQLRLELGSVVTGEGERGESGSWRLGG